MELLKVELEVPEVIVEMEEHIKAMIIDKKQNNRLIWNKKDSKKEMPMKSILQSEYCFGGGAFSNLYIQQHTSTPIRGKVINDVDIFVNWTNVNVEYIKNISGVENVDREDHRSGDYAVRGWDIIREVLRFTYKGMNFQIISLYHMERLWYFDFRFRNFYYKNEEVFASKGALEDIKNKEIVAVSFGSPFSSILRGLKFEYELGFTFTEISKQILLCCLAEEKVDLSRTTNGIEFTTQNSLIREYINEQFQRLIKGKTCEIQGYATSYETINSENVVYPFHEQSILFLKCYNPVIGEDNYDALKNYQYNPHFGKKIIVQTYDYSRFFRLYKDCKEELEVLMNDLAFVQLMKEYTEADFDQIKDLFKVKKLSFLEHKNQIDNLIMALKDSLRCEQASASIPLHIIERIGPIAKPYWSVTITYDKQDTLGSIYGEKLLVKINPNMRCHSGTYQFKKVQDGNYVLADTDCSEKYFYQKNVRKKLLNALKKECGNMRLGVKGDLTTIRDFGDTGYWFEQASPEKAVLNHNQ